MADFAMNSLVGNYPFYKDAVFAEGVPGGSVPGNALGQMVYGYDPFWGQGEFILCKFATASTLVAFGSVVVWNDTFVLATSAAAALNVQGRSFGILATRFPSDAGVAAATPFFGWVMVSGMIPATFSAAATVGTAHQGTAGNLTPAPAAGAQVLGIHTILAATATITKTVGTQNGSTRLMVPSKDALYPGVTVSGTGIPGATTVLTLDSGKNNEVIMSAAATATGSVTGTFTDTGFGRVMLQRPFFQGQIT